MRAIYFILILTLFFQACKDAKEATGAVSTEVEETVIEEATFIHTVFFWMKEDLSEDEAKFFEEGMDKLGKVPSIHSYKWGKPAGTPREVVDNSYTYAFIVDFKSAEDQDAYQVDPIHLKFIEESEDLWTRVQVYDTILE